MDTNTQKAPKKFTIGIGRTSSGDTSIWGWDNTRLTFDTVEDCITVIELAHIKLWKICYEDDTFFKNPVLVAPQVIEINAKAMAKKDAEKLDDYNKVRTLNKKPRFTVIKIADCYVVIERTMATYDPNGGFTHVKCEALITIVTPDGVNHRDFNPTTFMSGRKDIILHKKLIKVLTGNSEWNCTRAFTLMLDKRLKEIRDIRAELLWTQYPKAIDLKTAKQKCPKYIAYNEEI